MVGRPVSIILLLINFLNTFSIFLNLSYPIALPFILRKLVSANTSLILNFMPMPRMKMKIGAILKISVLLSIVIEKQSSNGMIF